MSDPIFKIAKVTISPVTGMPTIHLTASVKRRVRHAPPKHFTSITDGQHRKDVIARFCEDVVADPETEI